MPQDTKQEIVEKLAMLLTHNEQGFYDKNYEIAKELLDKYAKAEVEKEKMRIQERFDDWFERSTSEDSWNVKYAYQMHINEILKDNQ